jgi:hypothetical protein
MVACPLSLFGILLASVMVAGVTGVELEKLKASEYGTYTAAPAQTKQLREEIRTLERAYLSRLAREKQVHARDPAVRDRILAGLAAEETWLRTMRAIVELCDAALASGGSVVATGD